MKNTVVILLLCLFGVQTFAQRKPKIKGNRNVVETRQELPPFNAIELNDDVPVVLENANAPGVAIEADENLLEVLRFDVVNEVLTISSFYKITSKKKLNIKVFHTGLFSIDVRAGELAMKDVISTASLKVRTSGTARVELNATADVIDLTMEGISSGDLNVASDSLMVTLKDRIDAKIYSTGKTNTVFMYKNASAKWEGSTDSLKATLYGNSDLKAEKLEARQANLIMEDSPNARILALDQFNLTSKGSAKTSLYGNPKIIMDSFLDTSQLHKENN
ncbi:GIN domain-containing protein [Maribacter sp. 2307ULW6-5]|uniref:GIN domain-containing protein n=1 Tax=Maribacter sp. 2307ULW6-5 TaxID=3386275 RepID=UPI0039BC4CFB